MSEDEKEVPGRLEEYIQKVVLPKQRECAANGHPDAYKTSEYSRYCPLCMEVIDLPISSEERRRMEEESWRRWNTPMI